MLEDGLPGLFGYVLGIAGLLRESLVRWSPYRTLSCRTFKSIFELRVFLNMFEQLRHLSRLSQYFVD